MKEKLFTAKHNTLLWKEKAFAFQKSIRRKMKSRLNWFVWAISQVIETSRFIYKCLSRCTSTHDLTFFHSRTNVNCVNDKRTTTLNEKFTIWHHSFVTRINVLKLGNICVLLSWLCHFLKSIRQKRNARCFRILFLSTTITGRKERDYLQSYRSHSHNTIMRKMKKQKQNTRQTRKKNVAEQ